MPKVGLDIGHGGTDPGAIGPTGLKEKDVNLSVGLILVDLLEINGVQVIVTRTSDSYLSLRRRSDMLNAAGVDLVVSVHANKVADPAVNYVATFIQARGGKAETAAQVIQEELRAATGWPGPGSPDGVLVKNLHMTRETVAPAVVVEMGFISNPEQERQLRDPAFHRVLALAIARGICRHLAVPFHEEPPETIPATKIGRARLVVNGREIPEGAMLIDGKAMVWIRALGEALGARVDWDAQTRTVFITSAWNTG